MTIKKKMILSAITFVIFAAALQIALSAIITRIRWRLQKEWGAKYDY
ncbi:MAG TPA: hypothetical protein VII00_01095 [bacterium]